MYTQNTSGYYGGLEGNWGQADWLSSSPLFKPAVLKRAGEYLTADDLQAQYGYMSDSGERALRQQMQALGRPLTRAEQQQLNKSFSDFSEIDTGLAVLLSTTLALILLS